MSADDEALKDLLVQVRRGEVGARERLFAAAYGELRQIAHARLFHGGRNTYLDTTALVHESYFRFVRGGQLSSDDRRAFLSYASAVMRSVIVDAVRERQAERRGGDLQRITIGTEGIDGLPSGEDDVLVVHDALNQLAQVEPRLAQVVAMRYFSGYTETEIAEALALTERTVRRDWDKARMLLGVMLQP